MRKYPKYKISEIEWIGKVPEHWDLKSLRRITKEHRQGYYIDEPYLYEGVKLVRITDLHSDGSIDYSEMPFVKILESYEKLYKIEDGDFLFPRTGTIGSLGYVKNPERAVFASYLIRFRFKKEKILNDFLYFFFMSEVFLNGVFSDLHGGVVQNIHAENIKNQFITHPKDLTEQHSIVRFLDYKTRQISSFIGNRQKQIELLKEQKAGIINKAVTQGISPNTKMKDSGIEWIGDVPEHWEIWKVSRLFKKIGSGTTPKAGTPAYYEDGSIPWVNTGDLNDGILESCGTLITEKAFADHSTLKIYSKGTLLIAMYGATIAKLSVLNFEACTNQACCALANSTLIKIDFAFNWFLSQKQNIINLSYGGGQPNISQDVVRSIRIPLPPSKEQQAIIDFIKSETSSIDTLIFKYQKQIDLMQEYRTSLISQTVTGKIDVREWQPKTKAKV